jgi:hypothetical protein
MAKLTTNDLTSLTNEASAVNSINTNFAAVETAMENTLSRDGTTPNTMSADIDLNSNDLLNIGSLSFSGSNALVQLSDFSNGLTAYTGSALVGRTLTASGDGISIADGDGVSGNPTIALANDLAALEGLSGTGLVSRTASETYAERTITGTANEIVVTNGDGVAGNPVVSLSTTLTYTGTLDLSGATVTYDSQVATLTGTQTLTNKTLTSPTLDTPTVNSPVLNGTLSGTAFLDEDGLTSNSDTAVPSQQSVKNYVDTATSASAVWNDVVYLTNADSPRTILNSETGKLFAVDTSGGNVTINFPTIAGNGTLVVAIKKTTSDTNVITVNPGGTDTIDGQASFSITTAEAGARFLSDEDQTPDDWTSLLFGPTGGNITDQVFVAGVDYTKNTTTQLTLSVSPGSETNMWVSFDGVWQHADDYSVSGSTLTFSAAIPADEVFVKVGATLAINTPGDNTVSTAKINDLAVTTGKIAADAIDGTKIADDSINSEHYVDGSIDLAHLANESKPYDIGFQAGIAGDGTAEDLAVQRYGKMILPRAVTFEDVEIHMDTAGTGQSVIYDIELNGSSIFSTRPECDASSQTEDGNHAFSTTTGAAGDYLEFHVDQIGSGTAGAGAAFTLKARTGS